MAKIEIRQAISSDINKLINLDHSVESDFVFQFDQKKDEAYLQLQFRRIQLPRSVTLAYPVDQSKLKNIWQLRDIFLVALLNAKAVGYINGICAESPYTLDILDLVVDKQVRRIGIASALIMAAISWGDSHHLQNYMMSISPKNHAGISLLRKLGFTFCGYNESHYSGKQMAFYFSFTR